MVVAVVILLAGGILTVGHRADGTGKSIAVLFIHRYHGRHLQCVLHRGAVNLRRIGDREVLANGDNLVEVPRGVESGSDILEVGVFQNTVHILVAQREHSAVLVVSVRE